MTYTIKCCGPSKDYFDETEITIKTETNLTPIVLKSLLLKHIKSDIDTTEASALLDASMLASENIILDPDVLIDKKGALFLLPPVCGG